MRHEESRRYALSPLLGGVELLTARYTTHAFAPHAQDSYVLGLVERGAVVIESEGRVMELRPGAVLFITPGVIHGAHPATAEPWDYRALYLTPAQWARLVADDGDGGAARAVGASVVGDAKAARRLLDAHAALTGTAGDDAAPAVVADLERVALACARRTRSVARELSVPARLERARGFVERNVHRRVSLDEMAEIAGMSRFGLVRAFSHAYGAAPYAYALQLRLLHARRLLAAGAGIAQTSLALGFADQSHLTRWFLRAVGVTPGEFLRARGAARSAPLSAPRGSRLSALGSRQQP